MLHRCQIQNLENSLFFGSKQNEYDSEAYSEHCQTFKMELFEKIIEEFEPLTIFEKRSILNFWEGSEYASASDVRLFRTGKETNTIVVPIEVIQRKKYPAIILATVYSNCSKEYIF